MMTIYLRVKIVHFCSSQASLVKLDKSVQSTPLAPNEACHRRMSPCERVSSYPTISTLLPLRSTEIPSSKR